MANDTEFPVHQESTACETPYYARQRDVLFGAGCGLLCFGLFPFSAQCATNLKEKHASIGEFDPTARTLSAAFALVGFACILLGCVDVPRTKLRATLLVVLVPLAAAIVMGSATILQAAHANDVVSVLRHSHALSFDQELRIERAVNDLYCNAQAHVLCHKDDLKTSRVLLGLASRLQMDAACSHTQAKGQWSLYDLDPLTLIVHPTHDVLHWCGQYVATPSHEGALDLTRSPYQQHHTEVIDALLLARVRRRASTKLLMMLEWFAAPALVALVWWLRTFSVKIHSTSFVTV